MGYVPDLETFKSPIRLRSGPYLYSNLLGDRLQTRNIFLLVTCFSNLVYSIKQTSIFMDNKQMGSFLLISVYSFKISLYIFYNTVFPNCYLKFHTFSHGPS